MPANIENMFSVRQMPWHREGVILQDYPGSWDEARVDAGLAWDPIAAPVYAFSSIGAGPDEGGAITEDYTQIDGWNAITRSDTGAVLSIRPASYAVIDHQAMGEIIEAVLDQPRVKWETAGSLDGGRAVWCLAMLDEPVQLPGDDSATYPYLAITNRHDGTAACALRATAVRIVCHAADTPIIDGNWRGLVQHHPSFRAQVWREGRQVSVRGLPFPERVSEEHRYWVRECCRSISPAKRRQLGVSTTSIGQDCEPAWVHARDLKPVIHEIGYRIDTREHPVAEDLASTETAWMLGYAWGNGNLHGETNQVTLSVPDHRQALIQRISDYARFAGWQGKPQQRTGCVQITFAHPALRRALTDFTRDGAWSQKCPPAWAEIAPLNWQRALIQGYYDADGNADTKEGCILGSVSLDGLLSMRRILARLGIPASIRTGTLTDGTMQIQGRAVQVQQAYTIRFWVNAEQLGYVTRFKGRFSHPSIEDGYLWSRVEDVADWAGMVCPVTTATSEYLTDFGVSHNCANTFRAAEMEGDRTGATFSFTHRAGWRDRIDEAREAVTGARREMTAYVELATELLGIRVTEAQTELFVTQFIPAPPETMTTDRVARNIEHARQAVRGILASPTTASTEGTAYGLVQAAGEYLDHVRTARSWESRLNRTLLRPEPMKSRALSLVREVVAAG